MSSICTGHCRCSMMAFAVIKEEYDEYNYLLQKIRARMESAEYPIFVTAGAGRQKLTHIMHNHYLAHSYESCGSLVTFGFNFVAAFQPCSQAPSWTRVGWSDLGRYAGKCNSIAGGGRC